MALGSMTRLPVQAALLGAIGLAAAPAFSASLGDAPPKPRRVIAAKPMVDPGLRPTISFASPPDLSLKPVAQPGAAFLSKGIGAGGLASAGLRSTLPRLADDAGQCRAACNTRRVTCDAEDAAPECSPKWALCVAACSR